MVLELLFLVLDATTPVSAPESVDDEDDVMTCDDGSLAWDSTGSPNWACTISGCSPHESSCWSERLDVCFDEDGEELGRCSYSADECHGRWECFDLWLYCEGEYECHESGIIGCTHGTCTTAEVDGRDLAYLPLTVAGGGA